MQQYFWKVSKFWTPSRCKVRISPISPVSLFSEVANEFLRNTAEQTQDAIKKYCWKEKNRPFTLDEGYLASQGEQGTELAIARHGSPYEPSASHPLPRNGKPHFELREVATGQTKLYPTSEEKLCTILAAYGITISSLKQLARIHQDEYDTELEVMAHVTAYFDIGSKRIIDDIPNIWKPAVL